jgi:hypothetical protein
MSEAASRVRVEVEPDVEEVERKKMEAERRMGRTSDFIAERPPT